MSVTSNSCSSDYTTLWIILFLLFHSTPTQSLQLSVTYTSVPLPKTDLPAGSFYNGNDSIYLFGGAAKIQRYSLSNNSLHFESSLKLPSQSRSLPVTSPWSLHSDSDGNILGFGAGYSPCSIISEYSPATNSSFIVHHPFDFCGIPTLKLDERTILILGRWENSGRDVYSFDLVQRTISPLGVSLPIRVRDGCAIKFDQNTAYLLPKGSETMWEWDLARMTFREMTNIHLPVFEVRPTLVTDGRWIYILGLFARSSSFPENEGLFAIDPVRETTQFLKVNNLLAKKTSQSSVYVPKLNRIYYFGGSPASGVEDEDQIFYIELSPLSESQVEMSNLQVVVIGLSIILGGAAIFVTGWIIRYHVRKRQTQANYAVQFEADQSSIIE